MFHLHQQVGVPTSDSFSPPDLNDVRRVTFEVLQLYGLQGTYDQ